MMRVADSSGSLADHGGQRQAIRVGHAGIQQHQRVRPAAGSAVPEGIHGRHPVAHRRRLHLPAAQPLLQDVAVGGVVIDHQHRQVVEQDRRLGRRPTPGGCGCRPNRAVKAKVLPRPGSLSTVILPPIRATSRAAMVRPRPVPPYLRVVEVSSCSKARKIVSCLSGGMPMPVSRTVNRRPTLAARRPATSHVDFHAHDHLALVGELDGVAHQVEQHLSQPAGVADQGVGHVRLHVADQLQPLLVGPHGQGPQGIAERPPAGRNRPGPAPACRPRSWRSRAGR